MKLILPDVADKNMYAFESEVEQLNTVKFECEFTPKTPSSRTSGLKCSETVEQSKRSVVVVQKEWKRENRFGYGGWRL